MSPPATMKSRPLSPDRLCGEPFDIAIRALDEFGNPTGRYSGTIDLEVPGVRAEGIPAQVEFPEGTEGVIRLTGCRILDEGFWNLTIRDKARGYFALSTASLCAPADTPRRLFWGDMHGQTRQTVGTGMLDDYYSFARDKACVDFTAGRGTTSRSATRHGRTSGTTQRNTTRRENSLSIWAMSGPAPPPGRGPQCIFPGGQQGLLPQQQLDRHRGGQPTTPIPSRSSTKSSPERDVLLIPHIGGRYANWIILTPHSPASSRFTPTTEPLSGSPLMP